MGDRLSSTKFVQAEKTQGSKNKNAPAAKSSAGKKAKVLKPPKAGKEKATRGKSHYGKVYDEYKKWFKLGAWMEHSTYISLIFTQLGLFEARVRLRSHRQSLQR